MVEMGKERSKTVGVTSPAVYRDMVKLREEIDSIIETLEIMSNEELMKDLQESMKDFEEGRYYTFEDIIEMHKKLGEK